MLGFIYLFIEFIVTNETQTGIYSGMIKRKNIERIEYIYDVYGIWIIHR